MEASRRSPQSESRRTGIKIVIALAGAMWLLEIFDTILGGDLDAYGIEPRDSDGLTGVVAAPFLHAGFGHLISNTIPFLILGVVIALGGALRVLAVTAIVVLVSGFGTWLIAPDHSLHIGASGVVFGYASYLLARGIFDRDLTEIAVGVVVGAVWGGTLIAGLEPQEGISWQGHLFGAIGGVVAAGVLTKNREREKV